MNEEDKKHIIADINIKIGGDINNLDGTNRFDRELMSKEFFLKNSLKAEKNQVPRTISSAVAKAQAKSLEIKALKEKSEELKAKVEQLMTKTEPFRNELDKKFTAIKKLEGVIVYLQTYEKIDDLNHQMEQCSDEEQIVLLYSELKNMNPLPGHQGTYVKEYTHYWHNVLKEKFSKNYDDVLKLIKWPLTTSADNTSIPKEVLTKFQHVTKQLFLVQEPEDLTPSTVTGDFSIELEPCLPVRLLLRPLKKRFTFHFTGSRQTARIDRPEWFLTQSLTWIKDHQTFIKNNVQPVADKLHLKNVWVVDEFNAGLISLAAERLHNVLALYQSQSNTGIDVDAAFAHAVDETLGFHRELVALTGNDETHSVLSVLTKAETFVRWLAVEKKYTLSKMDETLSNSLWWEPVGAGVGACVGAVVWVPRGADWFVSLLHTVEERYRVLLGPGHRLQFLELQLELIEEWRVRLTQLLSAAIDSLEVDTFLSSDSPNQLIAVINAAHHTRTVLLQWANSLHYLQLHYYRRQFEHFTQLQHQEETSSSSSSDSDDDGQKKSSEDDETRTLKEVEARAKYLALDEVSRTDSMAKELSTFDISMPIANLAVADPLPNDRHLTKEAGVFGEAPALLAHLRDAGLAAVADHILMEFKAGLRDYKKQSWHAMPIVEEMALVVSTPLCRPLSSLCARVTSASSRLAPALTNKLRAHLANILDQYIFEEVVLENWFNTGGTLQFTHDVKRNLVPAFAPPNQTVAQIFALSKLKESCVLLNLDYEDARLLRSTLQKRDEDSESALLKHKIMHIQPKDALRILNQRTDLNSSETQQSLLELF